MNLQQKTKKAGIWQTIEVFTQVFLQFVYFAIMTRLLLKSDYGLMAIVTGVIGIGNIFIQGGMGTALIQRKNINNKHINGALQTSLFIGLILALIFFFLSPTIGAFFKDNRLILIIRVISLNFILLAISNVSINLLHRSFRFKDASTVSVISLLIGYSLGVYMAFNDYGVWSLILATLLVSLLRSLGYFYYAPIKLSFTIHLKEAKDLFGFGSGMMLLAFSNYLTQKGLNLIFGRIFAQDILGIYERAANLKSMPSQILGNIIDKVMFPVMSEIQDENDRLIGIFKFGLGLSNSLMIPSTVFLVFFSPEIVHILMGDKWLDAILPLQIMFLVLPFSNSGRMADSIIRAKGLIYKNVTRKYIFSIIIMLLSGFLGYHYGIVGAAIGIVISYLIGYLIMIELVIRLFKGTFFDFFLKPLLTGLQLGFYLAVLILIYRGIFNTWQEANVTLFIGFSILTFLLLLLISKIKPSILGPYLERTIVTFRN